MFYELTGVITTLETDGKLDLNLALTKLCNLGHGTFSVRVSPAPGIAVKKAPSTVPHLACA